MKNLVYILVFFVCSFLFSTNNVFAGSCSSNGSSNSWNSPSSWTAGCTGVGGQPGGGDDVTIATGHSMQLNVGSPALNSLIVNGTLDDLNTLSTLTLTIGATGTFNANSQTITIPGTSGTLFTLTSGGVFNAGTSTVTFSGNGSATLNSGSPTFYNMNSSGTGTKSLGAPITISNIFIISNGTFDTTSASHYTMNIGFLIMNGGTFTPQSSTINLSGTGGSLITINAGLITPSTSTFTMTGNGTATLLSGGQSFYNLTSSGTGVKTLGGVISLISGGTLSVTNGTFDPSGGVNMLGSNILSVTNATIRVPTAFAVDYNSSGISTITLGLGSTVDYVEVSPQTIDNSLSYVNLTASGGSLKTLSGATTISGNLVIGPGATIDVTSSNYALNVGGNWQNAGTFVPRSGTVTWNTTSTNIVTGNTTFYNLSVTGTPKEIDFTAGSITSVTHAFSATGAPSNFIKLYSTIPANQWIFNPTGTSTVSYVDVKDGGCQTGAVVASQSNFTNSGNNDACWLISTSITPTTSYHHSGGSGRIYKPIMTIAQQVITPIQLAPVPPCAFTKVLKAGMKGEEVFCLQKYLQAHNYLGPTVILNSFFGQQTKTAVIKFQKAMKLKADGVVGKITSALVI